MEYWVFNRELMLGSEPLARHWKTDEVLDSRIFDKIIDSKNY